VKGTKTRTSKKEVVQIYDRGNSGVPGERKCKRKKNYGEIYRCWMKGEERRCRM
jgi:hypothetical protein